MQMKIGLISILSRYEVAPCKDTPTSLKLNPKPFLLQPQGNIHLMFNKIQAVSYMFNSEPMY